jgi:hypothetical protein
MPSALNGILQNICPWSTTGLLITQQQNANCNIFHLVLTNKRLTTLWENAFLGEIKNIKFK